MQQQRQTTDIVPYLPLSTTVCSKVPMPMEHCFQAVTEAATRAHWPMRCPVLVHYKLDKAEAGNQQQTLSKLAAALRFGDQKQPQALTSQFFFTVADNLLGNKLGLDEDERW